MSSTVVVCFLFRFVDLQHSRSSPQISKTKGCELAEYVKLGDKPVIQSANHEAVSATTNQSEEEVVKYEDFVKELRGDQVDQSKPEQVNHASRILAIHSSSCSHLPVWWFDFSSVF